MKASQTWIGHLMQSEHLSHDFMITLIIASFMVALTVTIHFCGLAILMRLLRRAHPVEVAESQHIVMRMLTILFVVFGLFAIHTAEIWSYAVLYHNVLLAISDFETALYYSTVSFVSLGYGDVVLPKRWRLIGAIEAANGLILFGWSTAFLVTVIARLQSLEHEWLDR
jgi:Ion channel